MARRGSDHIIREPYPLTERNTYIVREKVVMAKEGVSTRYSRAPRALVLQRSYLGIGATKTLNGGPNEAVPLRRPDV